VHHQHFQQGYIRRCESMNATSALLASGLMTMAENSSGCVIAATALQILDRNAQALGNGRQILFYLSRIVAKERTLKEG